MDQLIFVMQAGHNRHEDIMESIELFGTEVLPEFVERDEAAGPARAARWAPVIETALARRARRDPVMPPDYVMRAIPKQMVESLDSEPARQWLEDLADNQAAGVTRRGVPAPGRRVRPHPAPGVAGADRLAGPTLARPGRRITLGP